MGHYSKVFNDAISMMNSISLTRDGISKFPFNFSKLRYSNPVESTIHQLLLECLIKAERTYPGGSKIILTTKDSKSNINQTLSKSINESDLREKLVGFADPEIVEISCLAANLAGSNGKIFVKKIPSEKIVIELKESLRFNPVSPLGDFEFESARLITIDGYAESVSDIHRLLTTLSETSEECVLICRGASDEVVHTVAVNNKRSLRLKLLFVPFNENGINTLKDISLSVGTKLYSSDQGHLFSSIQLCDCGDPLRVKYSANQFVIETTGNLVHLDDHLVSLRNKLELSEDEFTQSLIRNRIDSLTFRQVNVLLPDNISSFKKSQELDTCLRYIKCLLNMGDIGVESQHVPLLNIIRILSDVEKQYEDNGDLQQ